MVENCAESATTVNPHTSPTTRTSQEGASEKQADQDGTTCRDRQHHRCRFLSCSNALPEHPQPSSPNPQRRRWQTWHRRRQSLPILPAPLTCRQKRRRTRPPWRIVPTCGPHSQLRQGERHDWQRREPTAGGRRSLSGRGRDPAGWRLL